MLPGRIEWAAREVAYGLVGLVTLNIDPHASAGCGPTPLPRRARSRPPEPARRGPRPAAGCLGTPRPCGGCSPHSRRTQVYPSVDDAREGWTCVDQAPLGRERQAEADSAHRRAEHGLTQGGLSPARAVPRPPVHVPSPARHAPGCRRGVAVPPHPSRSSSSVGVAGACGIIEKVMAVLWARSRHDVDHAEGSVHLTRAGIFTR